MLERKELELLGLKMLDETSQYGSFSGYGNVVGIWDSVDDMTVPGAFKDALDFFIKDGFIAIGHDWGNLPIATIRSANEDEKGLYFEADFHSTQAAQDARTVMRERAERGKSVKLSIGYKVLDSERSQKGRLLKKLKIYEVSFVTVPANSESEITNVKGLENGQVQTEGREDGREGEVTLPDNSYLAGQTFKQHSETVLNATEAYLGITGVYLKRMQDIGELRKKEGRQISKNNLDRLTNIRNGLTQAMSLVDELMSCGPNSETSSSQQEMMGQDMMKSEENPAEETVSEEKGAENVETGETSQEANPPEQKTDGAAEELEAPKPVTEGKRLLIAHLAASARRLGVEIPPQA